MGAMTLFGSGSNQRNGAPLNGTAHNGTAHNGTAHNGTGNHNGALSALVPATPALFPMAYTPSWAEPEPDEIEIERTRLLEAIAEARRVAAAARDRAAAREAEVQAAMREELVDSHESLAEIERKYEVAIAMVRQAARLESERILDDARRQAALYLGSSSAFPRGGDPNV